MVLSKQLKTIVLLGLLSVSSAVFSIGNLQQTYHIKPHHQAVQLQCKNCHIQADRNEFKPLHTEDCLACHGSAEKVARRTQFMDSNHTNPHNSLHDGTDLDCHECHKEHRPSANLCQTCHDNTADWFRAVP